MQSKVNLDLLMIKLSNYLMANLISCMIHDAYFDIQSFVTLNIKNFKKFLYYEYFIAVLTIVFCSQFKGINVKHQNISILSVIFF